jgi:NAD(P) transhydrogenase subunit alpha
MSESLINGLVIFVLATFLGAALIGRVPPTLHGFLAVVFAMLNVIGGYVVTDRMLLMFKKEEKR